MSNDINNAIFQEAQLEKVAIHIGTTLDINKLLPKGIKFQKYTKKLKGFAEIHPLPNMLIEATQYSEKFIKECGFGGDIAEGATIYVFYKVWQKKLESEFCMSPEILPILKQAEEARQQRTTIYVAVSKLAKNKPADTFEAGLKVNLIKLLERAGARELANRVGSDKPLELSHEE